MKIDFDTIKEERIPGFKGGEGEVVLKRYINDTVTVLKGYLEPGASIGLHTHEGTSETVTILSGSGKMLYDDGFELLSAGDSHYCPEGHSHSLINTSSSERLWILGVVPVLR